MCNTVFGMKTIALRLKRHLPWLLLMGTLAPGVCRAQTSDTERARAAFARAEVHFKLGEFKQALPLYKEAYRARAMPEFLFNIGQCHRHLGDCARTIFFFRQFLGHRPKSPHKPKLEKMIRDCEAKLKAGPVKPKAGPVKPKTDPVKPKTDPVKPKTDPVKPKTDPVKPKTDPAKPQKGRKPLSRVWLWTGVGVTTALFATAAVTGVLARSKNNTYNDPTTSIAERRSLKDTGETLETVSWTMVGVGAAAAAGTAVLYWLTRPGSIEKATKHISRCSFSGFATGGGASLQFSVRY